MSVGSIQNEADLAAFVAQLMDRRMQGRSPHRFGSGSPEGSVGGRRRGELWSDEDSGAVYRFAGTPGENTGWVAV